MNDAHSLRSRPSCARPAWLTPDLLGRIEKVESGGNPNAVSPKGAEGSMQFLPSTAAHLNAQRQNQGKPILDHRVPAEAKELAKEYLTQIACQMRQNQTYVAKPWNPASDPMLKEVKLENLPIDWSAAYQKIAKKSQEEMNQLKRDASMLAVQELTIAAYNAGPAYIQKNPQKKNWPSETRSYVDKVAMR